ncbi:hypothetical protein FQA39_LY04115 [Lamprigera yunnana]|nr:hypothetical protein FQA39_LY04115 [Lamprigera yunnana]
MNPQCLFLDLLTNLCKCQICRCNNHGDFNEPLDENSLETFVRIRGASVFTYKILIRLRNNTFSLLYQSLVPLPFAAASKLTSNNVNKCPPKVMPKKEQLIMAPIKQLYIIASSLVILFFCVCSSQSQAKLSPHTVKNHDMLTKLGLARVRSPNSHHRKRLAIESRHHSRSDDSHMFIVKLPPNPYYYTHNVPNAVAGPSKKVPVGFKNNGKPAKIYHWNMPMLKKYASSKGKSRSNTYYDTHDESTWNEVLDKPTKVKKNAHKSSYYVPARPKKMSFMKYFPGNGKPQSFYVIEKSKKAHYHRLLP